MIVKQIANLIIPLILAPLSIGIINKMKALFAGRKGVSLFQVYYDIIKLLKKEFIYSKTVSWIFRIAPIICFSTIIIILMLLPVPGLMPFFSFEGDIILIILLLGLIRFVTVASALDTGSSFEGMGASREVFFSALAEPAIFFLLSSVILITSNVKIYDFLTNKKISLFLIYTPEVIAVFISFFVILLAENSRIPFDDPNTHLELTMIHEVMILDYSSFDLALMEYTSVLKLWIFQALLLNIILPFNPISNLLNIAFFLAGMFLLSLIIGIIESVTARLRIIKIPLLLIGINILSLLIVIVFIFRRLI